MRRILIDCDPGIDDSLALIFALKSPELNVEAITAVTGNLQSDRTSTNARKILELIGRTDVPVSQGSMLPLSGEYPHDPFSHGEDGLGNTKLPESSIKVDPRPASEMIYQTVKEFPGECTLLCLGPLTNVAMTILQYPDLVDTVKELILIGGAFGFNRYGLEYATGGNPSSEWNIYVDPQAAKIVFHSGIEITAIGLDVATHASLEVDSEHRLRLENAHKPEAEYFLKLLQFVENRGFRSYCVLIDSLAIAAAIDPSIFKTRKISVDIATQGKLTRGQTVVDHRKNFQWDDMPQISGAKDADFSAFLELLVNRITA
jgi:purine nucleosidase/pyrimidine-specific ribonucleoside hydrolase